MLSALLLLLVLLPLIVLLLLFMLFGELKKLEGEQERGEEEQILLPPTTGDPAFAVHLVGPAASLGTAEAGVGERPSTRRVKEVA